MPIASGLIAHGVAGVALASIQYWKTLAAIVLPIEVSVAALQRWVSNSAKLSLGSCSVLFGIVLISNQKAVR